MLTDMTPSTLDYAFVRQWSATSPPHCYAERDVILYALGVGACGFPDPERARLEYVWEERLKPLPTLAAVLARDLPLMRDPRAGIDWTALLHGEQSIVVHRTLAPAATVFGEWSVEEVYDKGAGRGALLVLKRVLFDAQDKAPIATVRTGAFLRANGGFGGTAVAPRPPAMPEGAADAVIELQTRPDQALVYRMSGDLNPLHIDPDTATRAGFPRPILHGLATYGMAGLALIETFCPGQPERLTRLDARFSASLYPGEALRLEAWRTGEDEIRYRCTSGERTILNNGLAIIAAA